MSQLLKKLATQFAKYAYEDEIIETINEILATKDRATIEKLNLPLNNEYPALAYAIMSNMEEVAIKLLGIRSINANITMNGGHLGPKTSAFLVACSKRMEGLALRMLFERPEIDTTETCSDGTNALMLACQNGLEEVVLELLIRGRIPLDAVNSDGNTALIMAVYGTDGRRGRKTLERLLESGQSIKPRHVNKLGNTAFLTACMTSPHLEWMLLMFLDRKMAPADTVNANGVTPLHMACSRGLPSVAHQLIRMKGSQPCRRDSRGDTPLIACCKQGNELMCDVGMDIFREKDCDPTNVNNDNESALSCLVEVASYFLDLPRDSPIETELFGALMGRYILTDINDNHFQTRVVSVISQNDMFTEQVIDVLQGYRELRDIDLHALFTPAVPADITVSMITATRKKRGTRRRRRTNSLSDLSGLTPPSPVLYRRSRGRQSPTGPPPLSGSRRSPRDLVDRMFLTRSLSPYRRNRTARRPRGRSNSPGTPIFSTAVPARQLEIGQIPIPIAENQFTLPDDVGRRFPTRKDTGPTRYGGTRKR